MTGVENYIKIVEWSDEDGAFVGRCPGVIGPCCHGADEVEVYRELCEIVSEWLEIAERDGKPLAPPTAASRSLRPDSRGIPSRSVVRRTRRAAGQTLPQLDRFA